MPRSFRLGMYMFQWPAGGISYGQAPLNTLPPVMVAPVPAGLAASVGLAGGAVAAGTAVGAAAPALAPPGVGSVTLGGSAAGFSGALVGGGAAPQAAARAKKAEPPTNWRNWRRDVVLLRN